MRERLADDRARAAAPPPRRAAALLEGDAAERRRAHKQRLLQDQHEGGGNDIARIAAGRIEERLATQASTGELADQRGMGEAAVGARATRCDLARNGARPPPLMPCHVRL